MNRKLNVIIFLCTVFHFSNSAKVLLTVMDQGRSHATSITPLMHRLQKAGHRTALNFVSYNKDIDFGMEERFINMTGHTNNFVSKDFIKIAFEEEFTFMHQAVPFIFGSQSCARALKHQKARWLEIANENWDVFLSDSLFSPCGYGMAEVTGKPHVMMHSSDVESAHGSFKGFSRNYALMVPNFLSYSMPDFTVDKWWHRVISTVDWFGSVIITGGVAGLAQKWALRSVIPFPYFSFYDYNRLSTFSFTDMPDPLYPVGARTNDYFSFGTYCNAPKSQLDAEWTSFVEHPDSKGTILVAFGTIIDWRFAPEDKFQIFLNVLNKLTDYRVIWSMKVDRPEGLGEHVKVSSWVPQQLILNHKKTVLFLSHGGLKSVKEAVCTATPSIFMPMFAEQMRNAWLAKEQGFARILNKFHLSERYLEDHIRQVVEHKSYQKNAEKFLSTFTDQVMPTLDEATFKFQRLFKYNGRMPEFFYPKAIHLGYLSSLNLDLWILAPLFFVWVVAK
uniref:glucuronosyltransferase n=1 Tax=Caenorhabditis japonica TaxID=281687 RepID=A0A8R1DQH4_CAEJA